MAFEDWEKLQPKNVEGVKYYLESPQSHRAIVVYESRGVLFILNPFGGGTSVTQELKLAETFEITEDKLENIMIFVKRE